MLNRLRKLLPLMVLALMLSACSGKEMVGPPADGKCITPENQAAAAGDSNLANQIDKFLKENKIITTVVDKIRTSLIGDGYSYGPAQGLFEGFIQSNEYQLAISGAFALFVIIYGVSLISGIVQANLTDAVIRVAKVGFISVVAMNWAIFYQYIGSFFIDGTDELIAYFLDIFKDFYNNGSDGGGSSSTSGAGIFVDLDNFIARIFSIQTFAFIGALFNSGQYAPVYGAFMILSMIFVFQAILKVVTVYVFSLFGKALLFALAPIFLAFLLFNQTKSMFDGWLKQLVSFSMQPIMVCAFIGLFTGLIAPFFDEFAGYKLCWNKLRNSDNSYGWTFVDPSSPTNTPVDFGSSSEPPISIQTVLLFMLFSWLFFSALKMVDSIVVSIIGSYGTSLSNIDAFRQLSSKNDSSPMNFLRSKGSGGV